MKWAPVLIALLGGCAEKPATRIDGSSQRAFQQSTAAARRDIPDADRLVFDRALRAVGGRRFARTDPDVLARTTFDGMTAAEVVADQRYRDQ